ncbi:hypothetical protein [Flavobacterium sp. AED]|uniref:hypothetical protein n=1 Tax=Flavobacterium sp. AED TaxID=1423323 RepID=UPI00057C960A|nr:hypothetical protein [Flavobacterium sp. AED]KIA86578.1 hypothetical protein OA85_02685 [Flavobacterium sp. AED]
MARSTAEIKTYITTAFINNAYVIALYSLVPGQTFEQQFSKVSLENNIFSILAFVISFHEKIVETNANNSRPQNQPNFRQAILDYHDGLDLVWKDGSFQYDLTNISDAEARKIIDRCAVLESDDGELVVKIATDNNGVLEPLTAEQKIRVEAYIKKKKVPGIRVRLINQNADLLKAVLTVYVNPLTIDVVTGRLLSSTTEVYPIKDAIKLYLANLEFDGAFVKDFFRTTLKDAEGIELVVIDQMKSKFAAFPFIDMGEWKIPEAGYFKINDADLTINYLPYVLAHS